MANADVSSRLASVFEFANIVTDFEAVEGFLAPIEGFLLTLLAAHGEGVGQIVEIGSFMGRSTCFLARGSKSARREKVHAVDHFSGSPEHQKGGTHEVRDVIEKGTTLTRFKENVARAGLSDYIVPIVGNSMTAAAAWKGGVIRLLFIDGDHSYEASKADFKAWKPHIGPRGCVAFHDINSWEGVTRYFGELLQEEKNFKQVFEAGTIRVVQRIR